MQDASAEVQDSGSAADEPQDGQIVAAVVVALAAILVGSLPALCEAVLERGQIVFQTRASRVVVAVHAPQSVNDPLAVV